jgi:twitching motility protein PilI
MQKIPLREYQRGLLSRIANPATGQAATKLGMLIGNDRWLVDLADVGAVVAVPSIANVPLTNAWFAGVANIRGTLHSIVDFSRFLGGEPITLDDQTRLVLIGEHYRINSGLLVSRILGLHRDDQFQLEDNATPLPWTIAQYSDTQANRWRRLDVRALIAHPDFLQIAV